MTHHSPARLIPLQILLGIVLIVCVVGCGSLQTTQNSGAETPAFDKVIPTSAVNEPTSTVPNRTQKPSFGDFDYFLLSLSWSPDYCASNGNDDPQQCSVGKKLGFVLHGLWPQNIHGYPSNCSQEPLPAKVREQFPGLYPNDALYTHEWSKHGTCSGVSAYEYLSFTQLLKQSVQIPTAYRSPEKPFRRSTAQLKKDFSAANPGFSVDMVEPSCSGSGRYLKEVYICFSKQGNAMACSPEVHKTALKSCAAADFLVRNTR